MCSSEVCDINGTKLCQESGVAQSNCCGNGVCDFDENIFTCPADECTFECGVTTSCNTMSSMNANIAASYGVGLFFNVKALKDLAITKLKVRSGGTGSCTFRIYHRPGDFDGFQSTAQGWTLVVNSTETCQGSSSLTDLPDFTSVVTIDSGSNHSFHVYGYLSYEKSDTLAVGDLSSAYNSDIELYAGKGYCAELSTLCTFGLTSGQIWNGEVTYGLEQGLTFSPTMKPTTKPVTGSPSNSPSAKPVTESPSSSPTMKPTTSPSTSPSVSAPSYEGWYLIFPYDTPGVSQHPMSRWENRAVSPNVVYVGRYGDSVAYRDLPNELKTFDIAAVYEPTPDIVTGGIIICGSESEVGNDPSKREVFNVLSDVESADFGKCIPFHCSNTTQLQYHL